MSKKKYASLKDLVNNGAQGDEYVYHIGSLMCDRVDNDTLSKDANYALEWYQRGFIELYQRRIAADTYSYVAKRVYIGSRPFVGCYAQVGLV